MLFLICLFLQLSSYFEIGYSLPPEFEMVKTIRKESAFCDESKLYAHLKRD